MTREQAIKLNASPVWQAFLAGKEVEFLCANSKWEPVVDPNPYYFIENQNRFRIKPELKRVPLTADDIPSVCWMRGGNAYTSLFLITAVWNNCVGFGNTEKDFEILMRDGWQYSTDRKNWKPCYKEVQ